MFKENPDSMRMEPTPERVLSLCRLISYKSMTLEELKRAVSLDKSDLKVLEDFNKSLKVAIEELYLIRHKDDKYELAVNPEVISTQDNFRRFVSSKVFQEKKTTFFMFSKWLIDKNEKIFALSKWEVLGQTCKTEMPEMTSLNENAVLGWRFWAAFLGLGYLNKTMIIPNMKLRIQDVLVTEFPKTFKYGERIRATEFIEWLRAKIPEADMSGVLPLALSAGFRTLNDLGLVKLETWQDSNRIRFYNLDGNPVNDFSHITVSEEVAQ